MKPPSICIRPLSYIAALEPRSESSLDLVVIHCTELPDLDEARRYGERELYANGSGNSGHFYIDRDGRIEQWVPSNRTAHHVRGYNPRSIGIELVNRGRYPDWLRSDRQEMSEPYQGEQILALLWLIQHLSDRVPSLAWLAGHEDLDTEFVPATDQADVLVRRKMDPGPLFPWDQITAATTLARMIRNNPG